MEGHFTLSLVLVAAAICTSAAAPAPTAAARGAPRTIAFIRSSCRATRYPQICEHFLANYDPPVRPSPRGVAAAALSVSADKARSASVFVSRMSSKTPSARSRETGAVRDCLETMRDSVDRLRRSVREMRRMGPVRSPRFGWHLSNVQTWVSAALTDESTCLDSLSQNAGPDVRAAIRKRVVEVAQVTSNALALVNRLGLRA